MTNDVTITLSGLTCTAMLVSKLLTGTSADAVDVLKLAPPAETLAQGIVTFDGRTVAVDVKQDDVFGASGLAPQFTIATWLRHKHGDDDRVKQHVMCSSDAEGRPLHIKSENDMGCWPGYVSRSRYRFCIWPS